MTVCLCVWVGAHAEVQTGGLEAWRPDNNFRVLVLSFNNHMSFVG